MQANPKPITCLSAHFVCRSQDRMRISQGWAGWIVPELLVSRTAKL
jgi:hypothetical protein